MFNLLRELVEVDFNLAISDGWDELLQGFEVLFRVGRWADRTEWSGGAGAGSEELVYIVRSKIALQSRFGG